jgi:DNA-binding response OmpR family regulator
MNLQTRPRILLVDDETELRTILGLMLSDEGYEISHAANGKDAARLHRQNPFNLVVTELILKDADGFETLAELRQQLAPAHFIATAKSSWLPPELFLQMARQLGAHSALSKPFLNQEMLDAVRNALQLNPP